MEVGELRWVQLDCNVHTGLAGRREVGFCKFVERSYHKHDRVKLLELSLKMEKSLWSKAVFLKVELSQIVYLKLYFIIHIQYKFGYQ